MLYLLQGYHAQGRSTQMFRSRFGPAIEDMLLIRRRAGYQLKFIDYFLSEFDAYCADNYPEDSLLTCEIGEGWIHATDSESHAHMARRVQTMKHIGEYQRALGLNAYVPDYSIKIPKAEEPHLFSDDQLQLFFETVDTEILPTETYPFKDVLFPAFFRLVYCCGLRTSEACNLRIEDVDLQRGMITVLNAKGDCDRELPLSDDVRNLCFRFDDCYKELLPDRRYFFQPNKERNRMTSYEVGHVFQAVLKKSGLDNCPGKRFTPHGLRHLFAVQNIRKCAEAGEDFYNWMHYLSRYMGHKHIRYTLYYLHITSQLFPVYQEQLAALTEGIGVTYAEE